jgi:beta-lactam-binding protein with PASTA domain
VKNRLHLPFILILSISFSFFFLQASARNDVAEIAKIIINDQMKEETEEISLYHTRGTDNAGLNRYIRIPGAQRGGELKQKDMIETFERNSARVEFTREEFLLLGKGTEQIEDCAKVKEGESCAMARFEGFNEQEKPFWYLKKGAAFVKDMCIYDDRTEVECIGTEYYINTNRTKTTFVVLEGEIRIRPKNAPQQVRQVSVKDGEQVEVLSVSAQPTPTRANPNILKDIQRWIATGMIVIRSPPSPRNGEVIDQPSFQLSGTVSDPIIREVELFINNRSADHILVADGEFEKKVSAALLGEGENTLKVQTDTKYGKSFDAISVIKKALLPIIPVQVPDVRGMPEYEAKNLLRQYQFNVGSTIQRSTGRGQVGTVVEQTPPPGTSVQPGSSVDLVLEAKAKPTLVQVPNVLGMQQQNARRLLESAGLRGEITSQSTGRGQVGTVVEQYPRPNTSVQPGSSVRVVVEKAPIPTPVPTVLVPNVLGMQQQEAIRFLGRYGFQAVITERSTGRGQVGTVVEQKPPAGASVQPGSSVNLVVEAKAKPSPVQVPDVRTMPIGEALARLEQFRLIGKVTGTGKTVTEQNPSPGTLVNPGSVIYLSAKEEDRRVQVPNVRNMPLREALARLGQFKLVGKVTNREGRTVRTQDPSPGTLVDPGSVVYLVLEDKTIYVIVPNVVRLDEDKAIQSLQRARLNVGSVIPPLKDKGVARIVTRQDPAAGSRVSEWSPVNLFVEAQTVYVTIPNVLYQEISKAIRTLKAARLNVGQILPRSEGTDKIVVRQDPVAGSRVSEWSQVNLFVEIKRPPGEGPSDYPEDLMKSPRQPANKIPSDYPRNPFESLKPLPDRIPYNPKDGRKP